LFGNSDHLICGDFNLVINPELDYDNYTNINNKKARAFILNEMQTRELTDPFRIFSPTIKRFTWRRTNPFQQARLDFFLVIPILFTSVVDTMIKPSFRSDHSIILL
jgi:exonuclease III